MAKRLTIGRTRVTVPALGSWEAVDAALLEIGEIDVSVGAIEGVMNTAIQEAKQKAAEEAGPAMDRRKELVKQVQGFCDARREEFGKRKSRELNHGVVGWRESTALRVLDTDETIRRIQANGRKELLSVKVAVNKDAMAGMATVDLEALGVKRDTKDAFYLVPDLDKVKATGQV